jgi:hypothetical protein
MTVDPRVARLRSLDTEATPGPWRVDETGFLCEAGNDAPVPFAIWDVALIAAMRNAWPAMVTLVGDVLDLDMGEDAFSLGWLRRDALAVLDTLDPP